MRIVMMPKKGVLGPRRDRASPVHSRGDLALGTLQAVRIPSLCGSSPAFGTGNTLRSLEAKIETRKHEVPPTRRRRTGAPKKEEGGRVKHLHITFCLPPARDVVHPQVGRQANY